MSAAIAMTQGWCPDMLHPMQTGDGLLVRLHPPRGVLSARQVSVIADASRRFGNGLLEVSARGNLQIRGVTPESHPRLVTALLDANLTDGTRPAAPHQLTLISPFAGFYPAEHVDVRALADGIESDAKHLTGFPAKALITVDGGGDWSLHAVSADIRITATGPDAFAIGVESNTGRHWHGPFKTSDVRSVIRDLLAEWLNIGPASRLKIRDPLPFTNNLGPHVSPPRRVAPPRAGRFSMKNSEAVLVALPYGRCDADQWASVARWLSDLRIPSLALAPWRGIALHGLAPQQADSLLSRSIEAGFITSSDDPRLHIHACPGSAGCARGTTPTYEDADRIALSAHAWLHGGSVVHVSGCAKGCAHPGRADLTLVGDGGLYQVVLDGTSRDKPVSRIARTGIDALVTDLTMKRPIHDLL